MSAKKDSYPLHIRFNDLDMYGHVNNAAYLVYFEEGRTMLFRDKVGNDWNWKTEGVLLVRNEVDYIAPILLNDEVRIEVWVASFGNKSVEVAYRIIKKTKSEWITCTTGKSVLVCFNFHQQQTVQVPEKWRDIFS